MAVSSNIIIPSGKVYVDLLDSAGSYTGEIYCSQTPEFKVSVESEKIDVDDIDEQVKVNLFSVATKVTRTAGFSVRNITAEVKEMFFIGDAVTVTQTTTPIVADPVNDGNGVLQGRYYQLGVSQNATGLRKLTSAVIKTGATVHTVTTDYTIDLDSGRIKVVAGGGISDGDVLTADITPQAVSRTQVQSNQTGPKQGSLRFISNNVRGPAIEHFFPQVTFNPSGDQDYKNSEEPLAAGFDVGVETKEGFSQLYIDGVAA